jgi:hypothetical protein
MEGGLSIRPWLEDVLFLLHAGLLEKYGVGNGERTVAFAKLSEGEIKKMLSLLTRAYEDMRFALIPQLPVELAVIEYCMLST